MYRQIRPGNQANHSDPAAQKPDVIEKSKSGPVPFERMDRRFYGATYLLDRIGEEAGITEDLKRCFPDTYRQILSIAYYLIMEDRNPLSRFPHWALLHRHPHGGVIASQRSSEIFASITEADRQHFFGLQGKRRIEREYLAYDITSISSYSKCLRQVRWGHNRDHDPLEQINLALLFGQESRLPFYYRKLAGNISDVKTLRRLLSDMKRLGYEKLKVVLDRGFFSVTNINDLYKHHLKFLIAAKLSLKLVKKSGSGNLGFRGCSSPFALRRSVMGLWLPELTYSTIRKIMKFHCI